VTGRVAAARVVDALEDVREILHFSASCDCFETAIAERAKIGKSKNLKGDCPDDRPVIPANFSFSQTMPFSMKKLIFNDFFCRTGIKIPAKPDKKSTKKIFKKPRKPLNNLMKKKLAGITASCTAIPASGI